MACRDWTTITRCSQPRQGAACSPRPTSTETVASISQASARSCMCDTAPSSPLVYSTPSKHIRVVPPRARMHSPSVNTRSVHPASPHPGLATSRFTARTYRYTNYLTHTPSRVGAGSIVSTTRSSRQRRRERPCSKTVRSTRGGYGFTADYKAGLTVNMRSLTVSALMMRVMTVLSSSSTRVSPA